MRVIAGKLRHRIIEMTNLETTRETQDKVRGAIFNMIGPYFDGGVALDLFAGSGAMGIEAYSRGVNEIYLNDINKLAIEVCRKNCTNLKIDNVSLTNMDYEQFLKNNKTLFDIIFLDPPYALNDTSYILELVFSNLAYNGIIVFEMAKETTYPLVYKDLQVIKNKEYGIKRVVVYSRK